MTPHTASFEEELAGERYRTAGCQLLYAISALDSLNDCCLLPCYAGG